MEQSPEEGATMKHQQEEISPFINMDFMPVGVSPKMIEYLQTAFVTGQWNLLDDREQKLISNYFTQDVTLQELTIIAEVTSKERVRQIICGGLLRMHRSLPPQLQEQYPQQELTKLKNKRDLANTPQMIARRKQIGKDEWEKNGDVLVEGMKRRWHERRQQISSDQ